MLSVVSMPVENRHNWALLLIGSADFIEGATRIQKYGFLSAMTLKGLVNRGFYNDWIASKYGPFSPSLADDIDNLVNLGFVEKHRVKNEHDYWVERFALSLRGKEIFNKIRREEEPYVSQIQEKIVWRYNNRKLMDVLKDVYYQFPEYAAASSIRPKVGKKIYESDSYLNTQLDESYD